MIAIMLLYLFLQFLAAGIIAAVCGYWAVSHRMLLKKISRKGWGSITVCVISVFVYAFATHPYPFHFAMPPTMASEAPGGMSAALPLVNAINFFRHFNQFEKVQNIGADPNAVPAAQQPDADGIVRISLTAKEVISEVASGVYANFWTYNGQVPGPMLRVKEGDTVEVSLTNDATSLHHHNIDFHAVTGPGGGAALTDVQPGETKTFLWKAVQPGLYVYHCAMANVSVHNSHGQYGMIFVDPAETLPVVDKEFYLMQGEIYTTTPLGTKGLTIFDPQAVLDGNPTYVTLNGRVENAPRMKARVGDRIRIYVGNGGVNLVSSFHVIGEIFDTVYPEASIGGSLFQNVQTTAVLPGGASIVEFTVDVPGKYTIVDHALARMNKGAWAILQVEGDPVPSLYSQVE